MAENKKVNFESGLEILMKNSFSSEKLDINGLKIISELLNDVNSLLIYHIETEYSSVRKANGQTLQHWARNAIDWHIPGDLKANALSEAYKQLALLESGCIVYEKDATEVKGKTENRDDIELKSIEVPIRLFKKGIGKLISVMFPNFQVDSNAIGHLALCIQTFSKMVAKRASEKASQKEELQPIDLRDVLPEYFGDNALKVAFSEGNRCMALYEMGLIEFDPKKRCETGRSQKNEVSEKILPAVFNLGIKDLLKETTPGCETDARAKRYLGQILTDIALYMAENASETCRKENVFEINDGDIHQSVSAPFPRELKEHAQLNGTKNVVAFESGMISYGKTSLRQYKPKAESRRIKPKIKAQRSKPVKPKNQANDKKSSSKPKRKGPTTESKKNPKSSPGPKKRKSSKSPKRSPSSQKRRSKSPPKDKKPSKEIEEKMKFARSVMSSAPEPFSSIDVPLTRETESNLNQVLEGVCNALVKISVSHVTNTEEMGIKDITEALIELFPKELAHHALLTAINAASKFFHEYKFHSL